MATTRQSMTNKPVKGYQIKPNGLVWYPISDKANYIFSNFYAQELSVNYPGKFSILYKTPAHYFHSLKAPVETHQAHHSAINRQVTPEKAKEVADDFLRDIDDLPDWNDEAAYQGMLKVIRARAEDAEFKKALTATVDGYLYRDTYNIPDQKSLWGGDTDGEEKNLLGRVLMEVRNEIYKSEGKPEIDLANLFTLADAEQKALTPNPIGVPLQNYALPIEPARTVTTADSSVITVTPSLSTSTSSSPSPTPRISSPSSSTSASPAAHLTVETLNNIKTALGGTWSYRNTANSATVAFPCIFENDKDLRFEIINHDKVSTSNTKEETLEKMLIAFTLLNPGKKPTITVGSVELETKWREVCRQQHIDADIKVNAPAAEEKHGETSTSASTSTSPIPSTTPGETLAEDKDEEEIEEETREAKVESEEAGEYDAEIERAAEGDFEYEQKEDSPLRTRVPRRHHSLTTTSSTSTNGLFSYSASKPPARKVHIASPTSSPTNSTSSTSSSSPRPGGITGSSS
ncbi:MAG: NADAR family protein [Pseudomonadota bacterium]